MESIILSDGKKYNFYKYTIANSAANNLISYDFDNISLAVETVVNGERCLLDVVSQHMLIHETCILPGIRVKDVRPATYREVKRAARFMGSLSNELEMEYKETMDKIALLDKEDQDFESTSMEQLCSRVQKLVQ